MDDPMKQAQDQADAWKGEAASAEPVTARSEDGAIEIEMGVDLVVRAVRLEPRATRDLDALESRLRDVFNEAATLAREANPVNARLRDVFGSGQQDLEEKLADLQGQMRQRTEAAEAYFAQVKARMEASRGAFRPRR